MFDFGSPTPPSPSELWQKFMDFCGKNYLRLMALTFFFLSFPIAFSPSYQTLDEPAFTVKHLTMSAWMFATIIAAYFAYGPPARERKFKTKKHAIVYWLILNTAAPLILPLSLAIYSKTFLPLAHAFCLTMYLTLNNIPYYITDFDKYQRNQDNQNPPDDQDNHDTPR